MAYRDAHARGWMRSSVWPREGTATNSQRGVTSSLGALIQVKRWNKADIHIGNLHVALRDATLASKIARYLGVSV